MAGNVLRGPWPHHARASTVEGDGRGTPEGQSEPGQLSENHCNARSSRRTCMSAPPSIAESFLPSSSTRELTVESGTPSIAAYARATASRCSMPFMDAISVSLPHKSTVILPSASDVDFGHSTGMGTPAELLFRIQQRMAVLDLSESEVGRLANMSTVLGICVAPLSRAKAAASAM